MTLIIDFCQVHMSAAVAWWLKAPAYETFVIELTVFNYIYFFQLYSSIFFFRMEINIPLVIQG